MPSSTSTSAISAERREPAEGALVVVGGNRGIGAEVARRAARAGMPVAIVYYSRAAEAERTVADIEAEGGRAHAFQADIGVEAEAERAFAEIEQHFGRLRGLVQCAVMAGAPGRLAELAGSELERVFRSNVFGAFYCCREASRRMSRANGQHGGAIVLFSSVVAVTTGAPGNWLHFAASKGALEVFSRGLSRELAPEGVRVNLVRCGMIDTETRRTQSEEYRQKLLAQIPLGRMGEPAEVAEVVLWLLSSGASYVSGAEVDVDGAL